MIQAPGPGATDAVLNQRLGKTEAGHREITQRSPALSRSARNLLLIMDPRRSAGEWLALVRGCGLPELNQLLAAGLVAPLPPAQPANAADSAAGVPDALLSVPMALMDTQPALRGASIAPVTARMSLADALQMLGYQLLYDRLTAEARAQLGLIKGYKMILGIERCDGPEAIRTLALQFVEQVRGIKGDAAARALAQRLVDGPPV